MRGRFLVVFFGIVMLSIEVTGQEQSLFTQYKFNRLTEEEGLTNNTINDITQDTLGHTWVATEDGLFRYLGNGFQRFTKERDNRYSLPNNSVNNLFVDEHNDLWILTEAGVGKYSYRDDAIMPVMPGLISGEIRSMVSDNGTYYLGRYEGGIWRMNEDTTYLLPLYDPTTKINHAQHSIFEMVKVGDVLWVAFSSHGVLGIDLKRNTIIKHFDPKSICGRAEIEIFEIFADEKERLWIGTNDGLYFIPGLTQRENPIKKVLPQELPIDDYMSICVDQSDNLWIGTRQHGLFMLSLSDTSDATALKHFLPSMYDNSVSHRTISETFMDKSGLLWLGTHNGGINVFDPAGVKVRTLTHRLNFTNTINYQNVWGIDESNDGQIWIGTDGKGLNLFDPMNGKIIDLKLPELQNKAILGVLEDSKSRVWIGTYLSGVYRYDRSTGQMVSYQVGGPNSELIVNDIRCFYESPSGQVYIGTNRGGLYYFDEQLNKVISKKSTAHMDIRAITGTAEDQLWLGTYRDGLVNFDLKREVMISYHWSDSNTNVPVIFAIHKEGDLLLLGTRHNGLQSFDTQTLTFLQGKVLQNNTIRAITKDRAGNLWFTTNDGIIAYNKDSEMTKKFGHKDGFQKGQFNDGSILISQKGYIVTGGIYGMNLFYPDVLLKKSAFPSIVFNEFRVLNTKMTPINSDVFPTKQSIFLADEVQLDYTDNFFSVDFMIPGFYNDMQNELEYKLAGYDEEWQLIHDFNTAVYRNVPPGEYLFQVKHKDGNKVLKQLNIKISPPIWRTWQAYILFFLLGIVIVWRLIKFNNSRIVLKQKLEFEHQQRLEEFNAMQEKLRFYTNFSHELKTPLTLIQGPVNDLISKTDNPEHLPYLQLIKKNTSILLRFIGRMLEFRKIEMNKTLLNIGYYELSVLAQEEAEGFAYLAKKNGIKFGFYSETDLYAWVDIEKIQIIMNNLLSNAIKFSKKGQTVKFGVFHEQDDLVIEVKDEGPGIPSKDWEKVFTPFYQAENSAGTGGTGIGLTLCKRFVELHGGQINLESTVGQGTQFLIRIPKGKQHLLECQHVRFIEVRSGETDEDEEVTLEGHPGLNPSISDSDKIILVVDDNADISSYIGMLFSANFKVLEAQNGKRALDLAIDNTPDIIISDWMMPDMNGLEFCKAIKNNLATSHIPVILLTAKSSDESKIKGYEFGADDYITKPFNSDLLIVRVNSILDNRKLIQLRYESGKLLDSTSSASSKEVQFILKVESTILNLLDKSEFSVPDLCKEVGLSQTSLYRKIKTLTGDSIQMFIRKVKIKRAAELLVNDDLSVSEVAFGLDFSDLKYFRKCFKEQWGMTPSSYKNSHSPAVSNIKIEDI